MTNRVLEFLDLSSRHFGVTDGPSLAYAEAAAVCLDRHHAPIAEFRLLDGDAEEVVDATWMPPDDRIRSAWANRDDATRDGAYGMAIAAVELRRDLFAISRAETRTGADYYLAPAGRLPDDLEEAVRLEVSGVDAGDEKAIMKRLSEKVQQARAGASNLPAIAAIVGFHARQIRCADVGEV